MLNTKINIKLTSKTHGLKLQGARYKKEHNFKNPTYTTPYFKS